MEVGNRMSFREIVIVFSVVVVVAICTGFIYGFDKLDAPATHIQSK